MFKKYYLALVTLNGEERNILRAGDWAPWVARQQLKGHTIIIRRITRLTKREYVALNAVFEKGSNND